PPRSPPTPTAATSPASPWVYYPWSGRLVHVLPPAEFRTLRSDRNRYKIAAEEQERLRSFRVGVAGLSVGLSVALTTALEGVGGSCRLADFDTLGLSNLNRLRAGAADLGVNKAVLAARQMYELDPYLGRFTGACRCSRRVLAPAARLIAPGPPNR